MKNLQEIKQIEKISTFVDGVILQQSHSNLFVCESAKTLEKIVELFLLKSVCKDVCLNCENCLKVLNKTAIDVEYFPKSDKLSVQDVEEIVENLNKKPMDFSTKFVVINLVEIGSLQAQNKLLKSLEEPPNNVKFLLTTLNEELVLSTIKSRCSINRVPQILESEAQSLLANLSEADVKLMMEFSNGYFGEMLDFENFESEKELRAKVLSLLSKLKTSADVLKCAKEVVEIHKTVEFLKHLEGVFSSIVKNINFRQNTLGFENDFNNKACFGIVKKIEECNKKLLSNVNEIFVIEELLLKILEEKYKCKRN